MNTFEGKTIILGVPKLFNLDLMIEAELKAVGFRTVNISVHNNTFKYKSIFQRIESFIAKKLLRKPDYKKILNFKESQSKILSALETVDHADYILIIRPEVYPFDFLKELKKKGNMMVGYQWNGLRRYPGTIPYIPLFDRFFVFDSADLTVPSVLPTTNFYPTTILPSNTIPNTDVFYTGSFYRGRTQTLFDIISKCEQLNLHVHCHLFAKRTKYFKGRKLSTTKAVLSYEQNIQYTYNAKVLLDLKIQEHDGLSFRILEAVGFEKKIITTNFRVRDFDFYHPDNILIWSDQSKEELEAFINKPYVPLPIEVKQKYSFKNWIRYMVNEGDYTAIELPK
jgi:hypothetical protein